MKYFDMYLAFFRLNINERICIKVGMRRPGKQVYNICVYM